MKYFVEEPDVQSYGACSQPLRLATADTVFYDTIEEAESEIQRRIDSGGIEAIYSIWDENNNPA